MRALFAATVILLTSGLTGCMAPRPVPGGYSRVAVSDRDVMRAALFAVAGQQQVMEDREGGPPAELELVAVTESERQVVAGMKYRLRLKVKLNGVEKNAEAVVWWQPWRKPESYRLISWSWN